MKPSLLNIFAVGFVVAGCQAPNQFPAAPQAKLERGTRYALNDAERAVVQEGVRRQLKDPTSPLFGNMVAARDSKGVITVCGAVNAKNSFGGYTGDQAYMGAIVGVAPKLAFVPIGFGSDEAKSYAVMEVCRQSGVI